MNSKLEEAKRFGAAPEEIARLERKLKKMLDISQFSFTSRGAMAYIGHVSWMGPPGSTRHTDRFADSSIHTQENAIADLPWGSVQLSSGGVLTGVAWSSAYWSLLFGIRSRTSVALDWLKVRIFGRDLTV